MFARNKSHVTEWSRGVPVFFLDIGKFENGGQLDALQCSSSSRTAAKIIMMIIILCAEKEEEEVEIILFFGHFSPAPLS